MEFTSTDNKLKVKLTYYTRLIQGEIMKFRLNQDVRIGSTVISEGSIVEVIEEKDRVASTNRVSRSNQFRLKFNIGNDAFVDDPESAIVDILKKVIEGVEGGRNYAHLSDVNGNFIGGWKY